MNNSTRTAGSPSPPRTFGRAWELAQDLTADELLELSDLAARRARWLTGGSVSTSGTAVTPIRLVRS